jgi:S-adenosylmethionine decarboxylase proenzyme
MKITQLSIDMYECKVDLYDSKKILNLLKEASKKIHAHVVREMAYEYKPQGLSVILFLSESHMSLYTWPEYNYAICEIFLCNEHMDPYTVFREVRKKILPKKYNISSHVHEVPDTNPGDLPFS